MKPMKNRLGDLNNHLFAQLERLNDETLSDEQLEREAKRAQSVVAVADQIVAVGALKLGAAKLFAVHGASILPHLPQIGQDKGDAQ